VRRPDGTLDWSGTRNAPIECEPRGHKDQAPAIAIGTLGGQEQIHVVYFQHDGGSTQGTSATEDIMYVRSTNGGTSWSVPINISNQAVGDTARVAASPTVTADDQGNVYVAWTSWSGYSNQNTLDIWLRKFNGATQTWEPSKKIESNPASKSDFASLFWVPGTGRIHVAWGDRALSPVPIGYSVSNDYGATFTAPVNALTAPVGWDIRGATVTETLDGTVLVGATTVISPSGSDYESTYMAFKAPGSNAWNAPDSVSATNPSANAYFTADRSGKTYFSWIKDPYPDTGYDINFRVQDGAAAQNFDAAPNTQISADGWKKDSGHVAVDIRQTTPGYVYAIWEATGGTHEIYASMTKLTVPTGAFAPVPDRTTALPSETISFSDYMVGGDIADFQLTRDGVVVPLSGVTLTSSDNKTFTFNGLSGLTGQPGVYKLAIAPRYSFGDAFGNWADPTLNVTWANNALPAWVGGGSVAAWDARTHALSVTGPASIVASPTTDSPSINVTGGSAVLTINASAGSVVAIGGALTLSNGGRAVMAAHGAGPLRTLVVTGNPSIAATSQIDLADNVMVIKNGSLSTIQSLIKNGFHDGDWQGTGGIASNLAAADSTGRTALGYASNAAFGYTSFAGVNGLTSSDVLVKYTYYGDADLSGDVTLDDFNQWLDGFQHAGSTWLSGDFDYSGGVTLDDFNQWLDTFQNAGPHL
jgi:hypothetical protein